MVAFGELLTVFLVKGPLIACGFFVFIDEDGHAFALSLVEGGHEGFFPRGDVFFEKLRRGDERGGGCGVEGDFV